MMYAGYGNIFNAITAPDSYGVKLKVRPGAFDLSRPTRLHFGHDFDRQFASTANGSLRLWQDDYGLAVAFTPGGRGSISLVKGIASNAHSGLSVMYPASRASHLETIDGEQIEVVERTGIIEISIVSDPLCPGAMCWLAESDPNELPPTIAALARKWGRGAKV